MRTSAVSRIQRSGRTVLVATVLVASVASAIIALAFDAVIVVAATATVALNRSGEAAFDATVDGAISLMRWAAQALRL